MLQFTSQDRETPVKRSADQRREDFDEIYMRFADDSAEQQSSRCSQCGIPFCQDHCPLGNDIPDWLRLVAEGRLEEAYAVSAATNNMPEVCGRICPQDRLCEGACVIEQSGHGTVTIGSVETFITETAFENGWVPPLQPKAERSESIGIIGAGPAGLAAAEELRKEGFKVTVYDRYDRVGGLLIYGIPGFKLEKSVVIRRVERLRDGGIEFRTNFEVGRDATFDELRAKHDAILIATGVYKARELDCLADGDAAVIPALEYLTASNRRGLGDTINDNFGTADGKRVVVIGGGDTAMDCVRTAIRQGASNVECLYRRDRENMPGSQREVGHAEEEGVTFRWLSAPKALRSDGVTSVKMRLGDPDASGRRSPVAIPNSEEMIKADLVIAALGFSPEDLPTMFGADELKVTARGTLRVHPETLETSMPGVYAAGDIVRGASLVVWAIRDGRVAAAAMTERLNGLSPADKVGPLNARQPSIAAE
ncbi:MAG: NAD(P)-dependent oxidoreductase [Pseudomonadota bacterium]